MSIKSIIGFSQLYYNETLLNEIHSVVSLYIIAQLADTNIFNTFIALNVFTDLKIFLLTIAQLDL